MSQKGSNPPPPAGIIKPPPPPAPPRISMLDYKTLLIKYIRYVSEVEGTDFIDPHDQRYASEVNFTDAEWAELQRIAHHS